MIRVLFVCHGNICRSTMAEFLFKDYVSKIGMSDLFYIESAGTSNEEEGNPVYPGTREILNRLNIDCSKKRARRIKPSDYDNFDFIIGMDRHNRINLLRFFDYDPKHKVSLILDYTSSPRDVIDPWYYDNFEDTYKDIMEGINCFYSYLVENELI